MGTKPSYQSKTLWFNLVMAVAAFFPGVSDFVSAHPELVPVAFAVVNIVLRFVSKDKVELL